MELKIFDAPQEVANNFSAYFAELANSQESFHVALSGGSTPKIVFEELATNYKTSIPWERIHFYWGDERCVPPDDDQSNYKMTREYLLSKINNQSLCLVPSNGFSRVG